jgi:hypothetical protein
MGGPGPPFAHPQRNCLSRVTLSPAGPCRSSARPQAASSSSVSVCDWYNAAGGDTPEWRRIMELEQAGGGLPPAT